MKKRYLMTPGPTPVPPSVLLSQARPMFHHRTPEYTKVFVECIQGLQEVFETKNDVIIFAASGTGAMESAVVNLFSAGDQVLVCENGKFGQRFRNICQAYGLDVVSLEAEWDQVIDVRDVEAMLEKHPHLKGVFVVQSETSTGVLNDVATIGSMVKHTDALFIVDSITGIGAVECRTDKWNIDVVMTGSQKGLMMPPGLACVAVSDKAWAAAEKATLPKFYFSYEKARKALKQAEPQNAFTPPVSLIVGLAESLRLMKEEGLDNVIQRHAILAEGIRRGVEAMGLKLFAPITGRGSAVTPVWVPEGVDGKALVKNMDKQFGITIAGGQDHLVGKIFRIGHLGYFDFFDALITLAALEMTLVDLGFPLELGSGVKAAEELFKQHPMT